jgi:hypothetical protein
MANLILQGQLVVGSNIVYTAGDITLSQVLAIKYYNSAAYDVELKKYQSSTTSTITFYNLSLAAGDSVSDNFVYILQKNDYLEIISSVPGTDYYLNILEV